MNYIRTIKLGFLFYFLALKTVLAQEPIRDSVASENIKTVLFYAFNKSQTDFRQRNKISPVGNLSDANSSIILEFDDLRASYSQFHVKIVHCNSDWTKSKLSELEYLNEFNEFFINSYTVSQNTKVQYYHFRFKLPKLKISGNYVAQVYENELNGNLIIQKRFSVVDSKVNIDATSEVARDPEIWKTHQQINLKLDIGGYFINNPKRDLKIVIKQNQRNEKSFTLDNSRMLIAGGKLISFSFFNNENTIKAGNEFRFVDLSSAFAKTRNVNKIQLGAINEIEIVPQNMRSNLNYMNAFDNNGNYVINNLDGNDVDVSSDYMNVKFLLNIDKLTNNETPLVFGKFNDFDINYAKMDFNPNLRQYEKVVLLKQGVYDFVFAKYNEENKEINEGYFEGDFSDTNNTYEVFVYQTAPNNRATLLIGYKLFTNLE